MYITYQTAKCVYLVFLSIVYSRILFLVLNPGFPSVLASWSDKIPLATRSLRRQRDSWNTSRFYLRMAYCPLCSNPHPHPPQIRPPHKLPPSHLHLPRVVRFLAPTVGQEEYWSKSRRSRKRLRPLPRSVSLLSILTLKSRVRRHRRFLGPTTQGRPSVRKLPRYSYSF